MNNKIAEFIEQSNQEIQRLENNLQDAKDKLKKSIEADSQTFINFGLAKEAEQISIITAQIATLNQQKHRFNFIFEIEN